MSAISLGTKVQQLWWFHLPVEKYHMSLLCGSRNQDILVEVSPAVCHHGPSFTNQMHTQWPSTLIVSQAGLTLSVHNYLTGSRQYIPPQCHLLDTQGSVEVRVTELIVKPLSLYLCCIHSNLAETVHGRETCKKHLVGTADEIHAKFRHIPS